MDWKKNLNGLEKRFKWTENKSNTNWIRRWKCNEKKIEMDREMRFECIVRDVNWFRTGVLLDGGGVSVCSREGD